MPDTLETYRTVTPYLVVPDADAELKFLTAAFGATEKFCQRNEKNLVMHAELHIGDSLIMMGQAGDQFKAKPAMLYLWVPNVDEVYQKALSAGATSEREPADQPYGHRNAGVVDARGITWWIGSPVK